jgi:hypothetical protein
MVGRDPNVWPLPSDGKRQPTPLSTADGIEGIGLALGRPTMDSIKMMGGENQFWP